MYFSESEGNGSPRIAEVISETAWRGIVGEIERRFNDGFLGEAFPERDCPEPQGRHFITGCNREAFYNRLKGDHPFMEVPFTWPILPDTLAILDVIQWVFGHVSKPLDASCHDYYGDTHYRSFSKVRGQIEFAEEINTIFRRHGLAFELESDGKVQRLLPPVLRESLQSANFRTEDPDLNRLLESARLRFAEPDLHIRYDALKDLWDAFERLKTLEPPGTKPAAAKALILRASAETKVQEMLDREMSKELESLGNSFFIRHANAAQVSLTTIEEVDYFFHRLFALIRFLLRSTGRAT